MSLRQFSVVVLLLSVLLSPLAHSATLIVPTDYSTIAAALNVMSSGDTVLVDSGTYQSPGFSNLEKPTAKTLFLVSKYDARHTRILAVGSGSTFISNLDSGNFNNFLQVKGFSLEGFSIGVRGIMSTYCEVDSCSFVQNGIGVSSEEEGMSLHVRDCYFFGNGSGIESASNSFVSIFRCTFVRNYRGLRFGCNFGGSVRENTIAFNQEGLALDCLTNPVEMNVVVGNELGVLPTGSAYYFQSDLFVANDVWGNSGYNYYQYPSQTGIHCNISANPLYCDSVLHPLRVASVSPIVSSNNSCGVSVGAPAVVDCYCGDVDFSGNVDISDITAIISYLYLSGPPPSPLLAGEIDGQTPIDIADLSRLIDYLYISFSPLPCGS